MSRNIVVICLDTVRKDFFDQYANRTRDLADISFEQCRAASSWSVPSHASILTGELPHNHGIHTYNPDFTQLTKTQTFLGNLSDYRSMCVSSNIWASSVFGFTDFFDECTDITPRRRLPRGAHMKEFNMCYENGNKIIEFLKFAMDHEYPISTFLNGVYSKTQAKIKQLPIPSPFDDGAKKIIHHSLKHIQQGSEPLFLFTNFMDAHGPIHHTMGYDSSMHSVSRWWDGTDLDYWDVNLSEQDPEHNPDVQRYRELYRTAIDYLDRQLVDFVEKIQSKTDENTTVIITADHGENLGYPEDGGLFNHVGSLSESLLHVPMYIINPPRGYTTSEEAYFSHLELGQLIIEFAANNAPDLFRERVLAELMGGNLATKNNVPSEQLEYWDRMQRCMYENDQKFLWDSQEGSAVYKLDPEKPCWQQQIETGISIPDYVTELFDQEMNSAKLIAKNQREMSIDSSTEARLDDLGYI